MKSFTYTIRDKEGVHARPAGLIVAEAKKFNCEVTISAKGRTVDLKRIFAVMGLCIKCGDEVTINTNGPDEEEAFETLKTSFAQNL